jgi:outer membrane protein with beta-barrel domain
MLRAIVLLLLALPLAAADFEVGVQHVVAIPMGDSGDLDVPLGRGFAASGEWFVSPRVSARASVLFVNPEAILFPSTPPPNDVDLGTIGLDLYSVTARYHFAPERRLSAFVGGGGALAVIGNLDDQFGDEVEAEFDNETTFLVEGGVRYRFRPRIFFELSATYVPLEAEPKLVRSAYPLPDTIGLDPLIVSLGVSWRF